MKYPIAIEPPKGPSECYGVTVPDLPGCFSSGETIDEAIESTKEAIELQLEGLSEDGLEIPGASLIESFIGHDNFIGYTWAFVDIDVTRYLGKAEKINVTLPGRLIRQIDEAVKALPNESRSGFLAKAALERLAHR